MSEDICRGWTEDDIRRLLDEASESQRLTLMAMAERPFITLEELAERLGGGATTDTVSGVMGSLAARTKKMGIVDAEGEPSWPFYIDTEPHIDKSVYLMPRKVAEIVKPGSRRRRKPWEI
jgi:hypothetical protein